MRLLALALDGMPAPAPLLSGKIIVGKKYGMKGRKPKLTQVSRGRDGKMEMQVDVKS
jgi:hypothetical protein